MRKRVILLSSLFVIGALMAGAVFTYAQPKQMMARRSELRERMRMLRMWRLTEFLNLDEKTAARFFPILNRYDNERENLIKQKRKTLLKLREALRAEKTDPKTLAKLVDKVNRLNDAFINLSRREQAELSKVLTLEQQAKLLLFKSEFEKRLGQMLRRSFSKRRNMRNPQMRRNIPPRQ